MAKQTVIFRNEADKHRNKHLFPDSVRLISASSFMPFRWVSKIIFIETGAAKCADTIHHAQTKTKGFHDAKIIIADVERIAEMVREQHQDEHDATIPLSIKDLHISVNGETFIGGKSFGEFSHRIVLCDEIDSGPNAETTAAMEEADQIVARHRETFEQIQNSGEFSAQEKRRAEQQWPEDHFNHTDFVDDFEPDLEAIAAHNEMMRRKYPNMRTVDSIFDSEGTSFQCQCQEEEDAPGTIFAKDGFRERIQDMKFGEIHEVSWEPFCVGVDVQSAKRERDEFDDTDLQNLYTIVTGTEGYSRGVPETFALARKIWRMGHK